MANENIVSFLSVFTTRQTWLFLKGEENRFPCLNSIETFPLLATREKWVIFLRKNHSHDLIFVYSSPVFLLQAFFELHTIIIGANQLLNIALLNYTVGYFFETKNPNTIRGNLRWSLITDVLRTIVRAAVNMFLWKRHVDL